MELEIILTDKNVEIRLIQGNEIIDKYLFSENNNLSDRLLVEIDNLIKSNSFNRHKIWSVKAKSTIPDVYTARRITEVIAKAFDLALQMDTLQKNAII